VLVEYITANAKTKLELLFKHPDPSFSCSVSDSLVYTCTAAMITAQELTRTAIAAKNAE
jgi:hypothetical protein